MGKNIIVKCFAPTEGKREFMGKLIDFDNDMIVVRDDSDIEYRIERKNASSVKPKLEF